MEKQQEKVAIVEDLALGAAKGLGLHIGANLGIKAREVAAHGAIKPGILGARMPRPAPVNEAANFKKLQRARANKATPSTSLPEKLKKNRQYSEAQQSLGLGKRVEPMQITGGAGSAASPQGFFSGIGSRIQDSDARAVQTGIRDVIAGKPRSFASEVKKNLLATELGVPEDLGRGVGEQLRGKSMHQQKQMLKKVRKAIALNPEFRDQPLVEPVFRATNNILKEGVDTLPLKDQWRALGGVDRSKYYEPILGAAQIAPAFAIPFDPTGIAASLAAKHMGINRLRAGLANTAYGRNFVNELAGVGFKRGIEGIRPDTATKLQELATDYIVSPAVRDPQKVVETAAKITKKDPRAGARLTGAMDEIITGGKGKAAVGQRLQAFDRLSDEQKMEQLLDLRDTLPQNKRDAILREVLNRAPGAPRREANRQLQELIGYHSGHQNYADQAAYAALNRAANIPRERVMEFAASKPAVKVEGDLTVGVRNPGSLNGA